MHSYGRAVGSDAVGELDMGKRPEEGQKTNVVRLACLPAMAMEHGMWIWQFASGDPVE